ncbi:MAG TPA: Hsp20/alpha crystallin family protein [Candidatus Hypogeohydataceae bacterium YC41]
MVKKKETEKGPKEPPTFSVDLGLGGFLSGLGNLVEKLSELAQEGEELKKEGEFGGKELKGVYGFSVKVGGVGGAKKVTLEPFGNIKKPPSGAPVVSEEREPIVDLFDEEAHLLVVAELPGVEEKDVKLELHEDILEITAKAGDKKYRKEVLLGKAFDKEKMGFSCRNGILEVRFRKQI